MPHQRAATGWTIYRLSYHLGAACLLLAACSPEQEIPVPPQDIAPQSGVALEHMDRTVRPQDDFFHYVNGGWLESTEIPDDRVRWGSFDELRERAEQDVLALVDEVAYSIGNIPGSDEQKVGDMYLSFMADATINVLGLDPLEREFAAIEALQAHDDLIAFWSNREILSSMAPVGVGVSQDQGQSDRYITSMGQAGLGLPDRDYYLSDDGTLMELRESYEAHIARMLTLADIPDADEAAARVLELETRIAQAHWTRVQNRDRHATYNRMSPEELQASASGLDWLRYLDSAGMEGIAQLVVRQPDYLAELAEFHDEFSMQHWRDYHSYHVLRAAARYLPDPFVEENFDFFGRTLNGQPQQRARDERAVAATESALGFMVGQLYVERHFEEEAKARMDELVGNLLEAFEAGIEELDWMSDATKAEAQQKLASLNTKIGYPDTWRDYSCVQIAADELIGNIRRAQICETERILARLGSEVDRDEWFMTPQTVNAYYSPTLNEIVFPAAILQPPFFNVEADDAVNYGAIGGVIGHEITHAFDDQGRHSDGEGNLRDWWTEEDETRFEQRTALMVDQYNAYEPLDGVSIQGELALGENIADLGGLTVAFRAYLRSLDQSEAPVIDGFTGEQRFFMGWAQVWRIKFREEALRRQLLTGPHSPGQYRVMGVLSNMPEFYDAFEVLPEDGMYRDESVRVRIW